MAYVRSAPDTGDRRIWAQHSRPRTLLLVILVLFVCMAAWYSLAIPAWEATDEISHFRYALFLREKRRLPVQSLDPAKADTLFAHHPPLYYAMLALLVLPLDTSDLERAFKPNLAYRWGDHSYGGHFVAIHDPDLERFPWSGSLLALHVARLVSVAAGGIAVLAVFNILGAIARQKVILAVAGTATVAFLPSFLFTSATVHNDVFVTMFSLLATWQAVQLVESDAGVRRYILLGILLAASVLSKSSGLAFLPLPALVALAHWRRGDQREALLGMAAAYTALAIGAGWWFVRNQSLYGDLLGLSIAMNNGVFPVRDSPIGIGAILDELRPPQSLLFRTLILAFGYMDHYGPDWLYKLSWLVAVFGLGSSLIAMTRGYGGLMKLAGDTRLWMIATPAAVLLALLVQFMTRVAGGGHGRYLFPVLPSLVLPVICGFASLLPRRASAIAASSLPVGLFILALTFQPLIVSPIYSIPAGVSDATVERAVATFGGSIELVEASIVPTKVAPGSTLRVTLSWRSSGRIRENYVNFTVLLDANRNVIVQHDSTPLQGRAPTSAWRPGVVYADALDLRVPQGIKPGLYSVQTGFYEPRTLRRLPPLPDTPEKAVTVGKVKVPNGEITALSGGQAINAVFGGEIELLQVRMSQFLVRGATFTVELLWQAVKAPERDYTVSIQLLDQSGRLVAQKDVPPHSGKYPTSEWEAGELVLDSVDLAVPRSIVPGTYRLIAVVYNPIDEERLKVGTGDFAELPPVSAID